MQFYNIAIIVRLNKELWEQFIMDFNQLFTFSMNKTLWPLIYPIFFSNSFTNGDAIYRAENSSEKEAILLVAFGSTSKSNAKKAYDNIEEKFSKEFTNKKIYWAYTSEFIRFRCAEKNMKKNSVIEALEKINADGIKNVLVQSLHFTNGSEYNEILANIAEFKKNYEHNFASIKVGFPLLVSGSDLEKFANEMLKNIPKERSIDDDAVIFVVHGSRSGVNDSVLLALQDKFNKISKNIFVTSLEGCYSFSDTVNYLIENFETKRAYLMPLLVSAGVHVARDIAGDNVGSLKTLLKDKNITPELVIKGLGEYDNIVDIFIKHLKNASEVNMK